MENTEVAGRIKMVGLVEKEAAGMTDKTAGGADTEGSSKAYREERL